MNTQLHSEDEGNVISRGDTTRHYNVMLQQALAQAQPQADKTRSHTQAARERLQREERSFWRWFTQKARLTAPKELSPAQAYQLYVETKAPIEEAPTTILPPLPERLRQTDEIDISLEATRIQTWNPHDLLNDLQLKSDAQKIMELQESGTAPTDTGVRIPKITKQLSPTVEKPLHYIQYENSTHAGLRTLITRAINLYRMDGGGDPLRVEISPSAYSLIGIFADWEEGYPGSYQRIPIVSNHNLKDHAVRCWGE